MTTVKNWSEIIDNLRQFQYLAKFPKSHTMFNFSRFANWYYFPSEQLFAPGKFLGYANTSISNYCGNGDGGHAKNVLDRFFIKLHIDDADYKRIKQDLDQYAYQLGKTINSQIDNGSGGGIFVPKTEYSSLETDYSQIEFNVAQQDIEGYEAEENYETLEGGQKSRLVNYYERDPKLRAKAIKFHGTKCKVCKFDFKEHYGEHGKDYIEVHHLTPLHTLIDKTKINPKTDMIVLCANCHRMIHRKRSSQLNIEELKSLWHKYSS